MGVKLMPWDDTEWWCTMVCHVVAAEMHRSVGKHIDTQCEP